MEFKDFKKLRSEIRLGSIYVSDYENSLGYTPESVCDVFDDMYVEYINRLIEENGAEYDDFDEYDCDETLREFWSEYDLDEYLVKIDAEYIADKYYDGYIIEETTYDVGDGEMQPCFKVYHKDTPTFFARIAPLYRLCCKTGTIVSTYYDNEWNDEEEVDYEWWEMGKEEAYEIAKAYL